MSEQSESERVATGPDWGDLGNRPRIDDRPPTTPHPKRPNQVQSAASEHSSELLEAILSRDDVVVDVRLASKPQAYLRAWVDETGDQRFETVNRLSVRCFDFAGALILLTMSVPLMLGVAIVVALTDPGPVLFSQERVGRGGRTFKCKKFRTMRVDAEARLAELLSSDLEARREWEELYKLRNDPRVTAVGRFLRRTSIDELPQLINVIRGEMSLVGPRPLVPTETIRYGEAIYPVLSVRPGLTGKWQTSGRNDIPYAKRVELDVEYVETRDLAGDLLICLRTIKTVLAYRSQNGY